MVPYVFGLLLMFTYPAELDGRVERRLSLRAIARHTAESFKAIWRTRELLKVLLHAATANGFFKVGKDYLQEILKQAATTLAVMAPLLAFARTDTQKTAVLVAVVYFAIHMNEFFSSRYSGRLAERVGHLGRALNLLLWVFAGAFALVGVLMLVGSASPGAGMKAAMAGGAVLILFFFYTLNNLRMPIVTGFLSDRTDAQQRATVLSVLSQLRAIVAAVVAPLFGLLADSFGVCYAFLIGGAVLMLASALLKLRSGSLQPEPAEGG